MRALVMVAVALGAGTADAKQLGKINAPASGANAAVHATIRANAKPIRECYSAQLKNQPDLRGTTRLAFVVSASGAPRDVRASGFVKAVDACIVRVVKTLTFPRPESGELVIENYPLVFSSGG